MINEQNSTQTNTPTSTNVQYGYPSSKNRQIPMDSLWNHLDRFDLMNISPMGNPPDLYSYYPTNLYQPFGTFDEQNQWGSTENSPTPLQYHPSMYPPTGLDITRNLFDYPPSAYSSYHLGYTPPMGDISWNSQQQQQTVPMIGNKKLSMYDEYSSNTTANDLLAQHMSTMNLGNHDSNPLPGFVINQTHSSAPKSYASVVSSDTINSNHLKTTPIIRSTSNVSFTSPTQSRYNRDRSSSNGTLLNWTTNKTPEHQYNPKDFNLNPKGARFFVIKSVSRRNSSLPFSHISLSSVFRR